MRTDVKLERDHDDLGEDTYHEWWFEGRRIYRDKIGRRNKNAMTAWQTMRCNNPDCHARAIVREYAIAAAFAPAVAGAVGVAYAEQGAR